MATINTLRVSEKSLLTTSETVRPRVNWHDESPPAENFQALGEALALPGVLFRKPGDDGGLFFINNQRRTRNIDRGKQLAPLITDLVELHRFHNGKPKSSQISQVTLDEILRSEMFLRNFQPVDRITTQAEYLSDFTVTSPGYNDAGEGFRVLFLGTTPETSASMQRINAFLDVMDFDTPADRANAIAGLLTVLLRHHWPGGKPIILATASKSHSGKDTVLDFLAGATPETSVSWEPADWATQKAIVAALNANRSLGMIRLENARTQGNQKIASAFVERFVTDPEPSLYSPGCGAEPRPIRNEIIISISTNFGSLSEDLLNRGLPIHLKPKGSVAERQSPIGNPRLVYLPLHRDEIMAEAHGMIATWKKAGMPRDRSRQHPFTEWAQVIGGILKVNGIPGFLDNYAGSLVANDPLRNGIALLGAQLLGDYHRIGELVAEVGRLGLLDALIPKSERSSHEAQKRGLGKVLSAHENEKFTVQPEDEGDDPVEFWLKKVRRRFEGKPETRYGFISEQHLDKADSESPVGDPPST